MDSHGLCCLPVAIPECPQVLFASQVKGLFVECGGYPTAFSEIELMGAGEGLSTGYDRYGAALRKDVKMVVGNNGGCAVRAGGSQTFLIDYGSTLRVYRGQKAPVPY